MKEKKVDKDAKKMNPETVQLIKERCEEILNKQSKW